MNVHPRTSLYLPALKCKMGDWIYFVTSMRVADIVSRVGFAKDMRNADRYSDWLQREVREERLDQIATYLISRSDRFFGSLVVSVFEGKPSWLDVSLIDTDSFSVDQLSALELSEINAALGLLVLNGDEDLFALDGQHRLGGLRKAYERNTALGDEVVSVLFVADRGLQQTRRLFTTLNRYSKKITPGERVVLDEDDAFAIVARKIIEEHRYLSQTGVVTSPKQASLPKTSLSVTTPIAIYKIIDVLCADLDSKAVFVETASQWSRKALCESIRPTDSVLDSVHKVASEFWTTVIRDLGFDKLSGTQIRELRLEGNLLLRPEGQMSLARAVRFIIDSEQTSSYESWGAAVHKLVANIPDTVFSVNHPVWKNLLWNPGKKRMFNGDAKQKLAARILCYCAQVGPEVDVELLTAELRDEVSDENATLPMLKKGR
ncbi:MAG: DNA sulfur modification protein DndB [Fimbriimonas sp.]